MWHKCRIFTHKILLGKVFDQAPFCTVGYYHVFITLDTNSVTNTDERNGYALGTHNRVIFFISDNSVHTNECFCLQNALMYVQLDSMQKHHQKSMPNSPSKYDHSE